MGMSVDIPVGMLYIVANDFDDLTEGSKGLGCSSEEAGEVEDHLAVVRRAATRHCNMTHCNISAAGSHPTLQHHTTNVCYIRAAVSAAASVFVLLYQAKPGVRRRPYVMPAFLKK